MAKLATKASVTSRLTTKAQTTIPQIVRNALHLDPGDTLRYVITDTSVILEKVQGTHDISENPFAFFHEWASEDDEKAFANF
ncbi:hypothetical protein GCM10007874_58510 [Labrys miyagiensis]|uniref:SpoVT-AbrB domain-containing protein n=1 Tax=Labrys miyagiensis TaxID=346912 RepID=A0ABQ6CR54_9HYPH|nr:hypothetical protein GCM10007874_58510 [Labrys miyagiensis]